MFSSSYQEAKEKFVQAAQKSGYDLQSREMPSFNTLTTDIASCVSGKTRKLLLVNSGIHGVEGYFGSAVQSQWLNEHLAKDLPEEFGVIFVHASNPHGFAHSHRVDTSLMVDNVVHRVDPNRNFVDFSHLPQNERYKMLENSIIPQDWSRWSRFASTTKLLWHYVLDKATGTFNHFFIPTMSGQYISPKGMSFGGTQASWTNKVFQDVELQMRTLKNLEEIIFVDLHTGIGEKGTLEIYPTTDKSSAPLKSTLADIRKIKVIDAPYPVTGALDTYIVEKFADKKVTSMTIEAGTESPLTVLNALRGQNWQDVYGRDKPDITTATVRSAFYPEQDQAWKTSVSTLAKQVLNNLYTKLFGYQPEQTLKVSDKGSITLFGDKSQAANERKDPVLSNEAEDVNQQTIIPRR